MTTLEERMAARMKERWELRQLNQQLGPMPGAIWLTRPEPGSGREHGPMVLVRMRTDRPGLTVLSVVEVVQEEFPLILDEEPPEEIVDPYALAFFSQAMDEDLILERQMTGIGFRCMVRTNNIFPTSPNWLTTCVGELDETLMHIINRMATVCISGMSMVEAIACGTPTLCVEPRAFVPLLNYANLVRTGLACSSPQDPRLTRLRQAYHERQYLSAEAKRYLT